MLLFLVAAKSLVASLAHLFQDQDIRQHYKIRLLEVTSTVLTYHLPDKLEEAMRSLLPVLRIAIGLQLSSRNFWETRAYLRSLVKLYQTAARSEEALVNEGDYCRLCAYVATHTVTWRGAQWWDRCAAELDDMLDELHKLRVRDTSSSGLGYVAVEICYIVTHDCAYYIHRGSESQRVLETAAIQI